MGEGQRTTPIDQLAIRSWNEADFAINGMPKAARDAAASRGQTEAKARARSQRRHYVGRALGLHQCDEVRVGAVVGTGMSIGGQGTWYAPRRKWHACWGRWRAAAT